MFFIKGGDNVNIDKLLEEELLRKRARLRNESKAKDKPLVISDSDILKLVSNKPRTKEEFNKLVDVDYRYTSEFLDTINSMLKVAPDLRALTPEIKNTLKELEKKLVEINKRNRMLYMPKLPAASYDLNSSLNDPFDLLFRNKSFKITNKNPEIFKLFNAVYRDTSKAYRDKGIKDLYVGYPFIKGKIADDFYIHAPLALFPITIEKGIDFIRLKLDTSREVTYNSHLILASYKFNDVNKSLPNCVIEDPNLSTFLTDLVDFYANEGIHFYSVSKTMTPFQNVSSDTLKYYKIGDYNILSYAVLARFSSYSTILQKDFEAILSNDVITNNLYKLLASETANFDSGEEAPEELDYVGELNSSQEDVLKKIIEKNAVVVEGPPGTGKSQTITSLVTNFILNGKSVLLVSEKKAALDVVYSRLGILNKFAMQIDDINDKDTFYTNFARFFSPDDVLQVSSDEASLQEINNKIKGILGRFKKIEETFYKETDFGTSFSNIYLETTGFNLDKPGEKISYNAIKEALANFNFSNLKYTSIKDSFDKFSDKGFLNKVLLYKEYENSFIAYLKEDLSDYALVDVRLEGRKLAEAITNFNNKGRLGRLFKGKVKKAINNYAKKYFITINKQIRKKLLQTGFNVSDLEAYPSFVDGKKIYLTLTKENIYYLEALRMLIKDVEHDILLANKKLLNYILYNYISTYEQDKSDVLADIHNYNELYKGLDNLYNKKKTLVLNLAYNKLLQGALNIKQSEKWDEINHNIVSAKRKYNLSRFIQKYYTLFDENIKIWLMTPEVVSEVFPLFQKEFDLVIFDEASQLYIEKSIPAIFRAKKLVVAGDSKQLRPSSLGSGRLDYDVDEYDEDNIALEEESLLELAKYKILPPLVLNFHYRSKYQELISFSNYAFYDDDLYISPNTCDKSSNAISVYKINNGLWLNRSNRPEAKKVVEILKEVFKTRQNNETIGIITFNSQQRDIIEDEIDLASSSDSVFAEVVKKEYARKQDGEDIGLFVKNIENVQGDERDIIIFSIGYAKNEYGKLVHNFGWLNQKGGENRLNVAITRAKEKIIVVTSIMPYDLKIEQASGNGPRYLKKYLEYCFAVSNNDKLAAKACLYSLRETNEKRLPKEQALVAEVYQEIRRRGFTVLANVGIGKYSIALAIKQDDKYILGLEFDTMLFNKITSTKERDYSRRKYMEERGWHIYRIWVMNWWRNKEAEVDNICKTLAALCKNNTYLLEE